MIYRKIENFLQNKKFVLLATLVTFSLAFFCWNCFNIEPTLEILTNTYPFGNGVMKNAYTGPQFLLTPFAVIFGKGLFTLRLARAFFIALIVLFSYLLAKEIFGKDTARLSLVLIVASSSLVLNKYNDWVYNTFFAVISLYLWVRLVKQPDYFNAAISGLVFGLGIYHKLINGFVLLASLLSTKISNVDKERLISHKTYAVFIAMILLGSSPLIVYNFHNDFETYSTALSTVRNSFRNKLQVINARLNQLSVLFVPQKKIFNIAFGEMKEAKNIVNPNFIFLPLLFSLPLYFSGSKNSLFLLSFIFVFFILNTFVPGGEGIAKFNIQHNLPLMPFISISIASIIKSAWSNKKLLFYVILPFVVALITLNLFSYVYFYEHIGNSRWVDKNRPQVSLVHGKARMEINDIYEGDNFLLLPSKPSKVAQWTKQNCKSYRSGPQGQFFGCKCKLSEILTEDCEHPSALIVPYPGYLPKGSDMWTKRNCKSPNLNKSACYKPYIFLQKAAENSRIRISRKSYIKNELDRRVYVIMNITCGINHNRDLNNKVINSLH